MNFLVGTAVWAALHRLPSPLPAPGEWRIGGHPLPNGANIREEPYLPPDAVIVCDHAWMPLPKPVSP